MNQIRPNDRPDNGWSKVTTTAKRDQQEHKALYRPYASYSIVIMLQGDRWLVSRADVSPDFGAPGLATVSNVHDSHVCYSEDEVMGCVSMNYGMLVNEDELLHLES